MGSTVTMQDVTRALRLLGVNDGDILLYHSSMKSFGHVEGGPEAVIRGALEAVGGRGTLVAPTLVQRDFQNAYKNWNVHTSPSDVGLLTETLRRWPGALRSDQATHSVAAVGNEAKLITEGHTAYGPRYTLYGEYVFSKSSPWQKMYDHKGKVVFIGVTVRVNTYRHFVEARFAEELLDAIPECAEKTALMARLATHDQYDEYCRQLGAQKNGVPMTLCAVNFNGDKMQKLQPRLRELNIEKTCMCGDAQLLLYDIRAMVNVMDRAVREETDQWFSGLELDWIYDAQALGRR